MNSRDQVLGLLEQFRGSYISGEEIAKQLSLSRTAVWKAIQKLRDDGYRIEAITKRGYCLIQENDILSEQGICAHLKHSSFDGSIYVYDCIDSTNRKLKQMAIDGAPHGTVLVSKEQTSGSGRGNHMFFSPRGGIYLSVLLRPDHNKRDCKGMWTAFAAVCAADSILELTGRDIQIRWTNDLINRSKKVGGILIEAGDDFESGEIEWLVIGIGLNFETGQEMFPAELRGKAGSLFDIQDDEKKVSYRKPSRNAMAAELIRRLLCEMPVREKEIYEKYKQRLTCLGRDVRISSENGEFRARAVDLDETFRLVVQKEDGEMVHLPFGRYSVREETSEERAGGNHAVRGNGIPAAE